MSNKTEVTNSGIGFFGLLTILFIGLKLSGHIDWSWWWVLAPMWAPFSFVLAVILMICLIFFIADLIDNAWTRRNR